MFRFYALRAVFFLLFFCFFVPAHAASSLSYQSTPGELILRDKAGKELGICPLKRTEVEANIVGFAARVHVRQQFVNKAKTPVEAIYTFPLPADAAVDDMTMRIGNRLIRGQIKKREEAQKIYQDAKNAGQAAALLDQERPNIFTQSVANLMPGQEVVINLSFVNLLKYDDGEYEWSFPTVVGPRYTGGASAGENPKKITPPITPKNTRAGHDISLTVNLDAGLPLRYVTSPLHPIDVQRQGAKRAKIQLRDVATLPNKDFVLRYKVAGNEVQSGVIAYSPSGTQGGYFTLILQPPDAPKNDEVAPKEMVFVIDQTGSQQGLPIEKAKNTISYCLQNLNAGDTFQLLGFNTSVYPCFPKPVAVTKANVQKAQEWLMPLAGAGGTDILKATDYALQMPTDPKRPRIVCYMTDGYVGNDQQIIQYVAAHRGQARMFPFGVGNSVNRFLIDGMAREGRGQADYILLNEDANAHAKKFYERMAQPLLLNIEVDWGNLPVEDVLPRHIPDVFSSGPIIVKGRYKRGMKGEILVRGLLRGKPWSEIIPVNLPEEPTESAEALPSLWAREKINDIEFEGWKTNARDTQAKITNVALNYRLMSAYTSFVAVEQRVINQGGKQKTVQVPVEMPDGVSYEGIFGQQQSQGRSLNFYSLRSRYIAAPPGQMAAPFALPPATYTGTPRQIRSTTAMPFQARGPIFLPQGAVNLARGKPVSASDDFPIIGALSMITDGRKEGTEGNWVELGPGTQWVQIDLQKTCTLNGLLLWHYFGESRVYRDVVIQIADDADFTKNVRTIFNNDRDNSSGLGVGKEREFYEHSQGQWIPLKNLKARYVRLYSRGNSSDPQNQYIEVEVWGLPPGVKTGVKSSAPKAVVPPRKK